MKVLFKYFNRLCDNKLACMYGGVSRFEILFFFWKFFRKLGRPVTAKQNFTEYFRVVPEELFSFYDNREQSDEFFENKVCRWQATH